MQSFGWKRKRTISQSKLSLFNEDEEQLDPTIDWLTASKRPKGQKYWLFQAFLLEDNVSKAKRLREEGTTLAESERWWEAIGRWNETLSLTPDDYKVMDMLSQAFLKVGEIYPALQSASKVINLAPFWWPGYQTLGRTQLGVGEVLMAIKSFSRAIRLAPDQMELWEEDLEWALRLRDKQKELEKFVEDDSQKCEPKKSDQIRFISPDMLITHDRNDDRPRPNEDNPGSLEETNCEAGKSCLMVNTSMVRFRR